MSLGHLSKSLNFICTALKQKTSLYPDFVETDRSTSFYNGAGRLSASDTGQIMSRIAIFDGLKNPNIRAISISAALLIIAGGLGFAAQDKYTLQVPGGLAFSEFRGYESWPVISISENQGVIAVIMGNPATVDAFKAGVPGNGQPFPDGAKMAKIHWSPKKQEAYPGAPTVPGTQHDVDFMVKDSKRFVDSGGWGYGAFDYDTASDTFSPATEADTPPQAHDAKCGAACHTLVKNRDYVFTEYGHR